MSATANDEGEILTLTRQRRRVIEKLAETVHGKIVRDCQSHTEMCTAIGMLMTSMAALCGPEGEHQMIDLLCETAHGVLRENRGAN